MRRRQFFGAPVTVLAALVAVSVVAAGCSSTTQDQQTSSAANRYNTTDVMFVQGMIPHHEQAVTMSTMAQTRASDAKVVDLAARISAAQQPEIDQMRSWLADWKVDESAMNEHLAMGHGIKGMQMQGMLTAAQLEALANESGAAFDARYLRDMIEHHQGAVVMAKNVKARGWSPRVTELADAIIVSQSKEIALMQKWLDAQ
jgi:uncharacterized protein (DUF305 family)